MTQHSKIKANTAVLLTNLGTPDAPTTRAVRRYLREFLADPRVVNLPRFIWYPILYGIILPFRSSATARLYKSIWTEKGSPLLDITQQQANLLQQALGDDVIVAAAMRYGQPNIRDVLKSLEKQQVRKLIVLPLYPQYSASTTASTYDAVASALKNWRWIPEVQWVNGYADHPLYIEAIAQSIEAHRQEHPGAQQLIFSFHGLPKKMLTEGDPYYCFCQKTARLVAENLQLNPDEYQVTFQSRLGKAEWIKPYTETVMRELPKQGSKHIDVISPGFSADCLETLEEIAQRNRDYFIDAGGEEYHYIPALNTSNKHIELMAELIR